MLICNECGAQFCEADKRQDEIGYVYGVCPGCGDTDIEDAHQCPICGEWTAEEVCSSCRERIVAGILGTISGLMVTTDAGRRAAVDVVADWVEAQ